MRRYPSLLSRRTVVYVGDYPPNMTGTAMFTLDLLNATDLFGWQSAVIAIEERLNCATDWDDAKVVATIRPGDAFSFEAAAEYIRREHIDVVCIHHTPTFFQSAANANLIAFVRSLGCPAAAIMHSIDREPSEAEKTALSDLAPDLSAFITMAHFGKRLLRDVYAIPSGKIAYIPHGAPQSEVTDEERAKAKARLGLSGKTVLTTFGLLTPDKGFDDVIAALPSIVRRHPEVIFLVLGAIRPATLASEGEVCRGELERMARALGVKEHVRFDESYLSLPQLAEYLAATDIYIHAEHADRQKIASGALAYAFASGSVIVSTPTHYAVELLAHRRGYLFPFRDPHALALRIRMILDDPTDFANIRQRAYGYSRGMTWESVGVKYVELFNRLIQNWPEKTDIPATLKAPRGLPSTAVWESARLSAAPEEEHHAILGDASGT